MARPISAAHGLRRDEILNVAADCFARQSYPATSMNDIAAAGGTSKARLYHYYESKEAILFDLVDRYTQKLLAIIGQVHATAQRQALSTETSYTLKVLPRGLARELASIPTVCGSLREALEELEKDMDFLLAGDVFTKDQLDSYIALKWEEVYAFEHTPHPVEYLMYYSC